MAETQDLGTHRAIWGYLRRTRQRLVAATRTNPVHAGRLGPVIEALASAEAALIEEDPELPFRRGRGPRAVTVPGNGGAEALSHRIEELERAVRQREEHIAIVTHDIREPLSPVLLMVRRLLEDVTEKGASFALATLAPRVQSISSRLDQFVRMLNRLLDATQLQTGDVSLDPEDLDLVVVAREIAAEVAEGTRTPVEIHVTGDPSVDGRWDRLRLDEILRNLIGNAVRFGTLTPVEVEVRGKGALVTIAVRDRGVGIAPADHERIFEKHVRLANRSGFGLGLWIVRQIVRAMDGAIEVDSDIGRGAAFTVTLPRRVRR